MPEVEPHPGRVEAEPARAPPADAARAADWRVGAAAVIRSGSPRMQVDTARALQRALGNRRFGRMLARQTPGQAAFATARTWLDQDANIKIEVDVLRAAIRQVTTTGKSVEFNRNAGMTRLATALSLLGKDPDQPTVEAEWNWLIDNRASAGTESYKTRERAFFAHFETPLAAESAAHEGSHTNYWLQNSPAQVLDEIIWVATSAGLPPAELYAYAMVEGLDDYVRDEIGFGSEDKSRPTLLQLANVSTTNPIAGFAHLGIDDFWLDLHAIDEPLTRHLPIGYDISLLAHQSAWNEETPKRLVDSARFPTLMMGLQALAASIKRRRALFVADASAFGYAAPTRDELVYWTYIYSNVGENVSQLEKYQGERKLSDWITKGEYPNAIKLLQSFRMIEKMAIF